MRPSLENPVDGPVATLDSVRLSLPRLFTSARALGSRVEPSPIRIEVSRWKYSTYLGRFDPIQSALPEAL